MSTTLPIKWNPKVVEFNSSIPIRYVDGFAYRDDLEPGDAAWGKSGGTKSIENAVLKFSCPCGCKAWGSIPLSHFQSGGWTWNGSKERPTLRPSIQMLCKCRWHGWLTEGIFIRC